MSFQQAVPQTTSQTLHHFFVIEIRESQINKRDGSSSPKSKRCSFAFNMIYRFSSFPKDCGGGFSPSLVTQCDEHLTHTDIVGQPKFKLIVGSASKGFDLH